MEGDSGSPVSGRLGPIQRGLGSGAVSLPNDPPSRADPTPPFSEGKPPTPADGTTDPRARYTWENFGKSERALELPQGTDKHREGNRMAELTIEDFVTDLNLNLNRLTGIVEEVSQAVADGNLDGAALVLGTQSGKIGRFNESYQALYARLDEEGASPDKALGRE